MQPTPNLLPTSSRSRTRIISRMPTLSRTSLIARGVALVGAGLLAIACSAPPAAAPTTAAPAAQSTTAPAPASATTAPVPTAVARTTQPAATGTQPATTGAAAASGTQPATTPGQPVPTAAAAQTASAAAASDAVRLVLDSSASNASYHARETLVGKTLPSDAVGTSPGVTGTLVLGPDGAVLADQSTISVDLTKLKSDESRRDNFIKGNTLETSTYPMATFVARSVQGLPTPLPRSGQATFQLLGDLTVHGVTKPATWQVTAQFADATVSGSATTSVNLTDFGMTPPKVGPVLNIENGLTLELAFTANRDA